MTDMARRSIGADTTISGAHFRDVYQNHWHSDYFHEGATFDFEDEFGRFILADDARVRLGDCGYLIPNFDGRNLAEMPFQELYRRLYEVRTTDIVVCEVPIEALDELRAAISPVL